MNIGYFIANSPHYLPTVIPLICKTGGIILTFNKHTERYIEQVPHKNFSILYYRNYVHLLRGIKNLSITIMIHPSFSIQYFTTIQGIKHVQVFHGTSDKPFNYHKSLNRYDLIAVPGPKMRDEIIKMGLSVPERLVVVGYPKIDAFLHSRFDRNAFKKRLGIDNTRKNVLYSPTWNDPNKYSSFPNYIGTILKNLREFNLIVKPHPDILKYKPWQIMKAYFLKRRNCLFYPKSSNILPFMAISDILLTDISSVSHEYLPFDKPMVFLNPKPKAGIPEEHKWIWRCGDIIEDGGEITDVVKENLKNPEKYKMQRKSALHHVFLSFDGKSSDRFEEALYQLLY